MTYDWDPWHRKPQSSFDKIYWEERKGLAAEHISSIEAPPEDVSLALRMLARSGEVGVTATTAKEQRLALLLHLSGHLMLIRAHGLFAEPSPIIDLFRSISDLDAGHVDPTLQPERRRKGSPWRHNDFQQDVLTISALLDRAGELRREADALIFSELRAVAQSVGLKWTPNSVRNMRQAERRADISDPLPTAQRQLHVFRRSDLIAAPPKSAVGATRRSAEEVDARAKAAQEARRIIAMWKKQLNPVSAID